MLCLECENARFAILVKKHSIEVEDLGKEDMAKLLV